MRAGRDTSRMIRRLFKFLNIAATHLEEISLEKQTLIHEKKKIKNKQNYIY